MTAVITVVLAAAAVWYVLAPLWRRLPAPDRSVSVERARLAAERETALRVLSDLALDHATGKMSDADYEALRGRQETAAMEALRRLDAMDAPKPGTRPGPASARPPE
ncbi:MAG TPA: hypothetical protein VKT83_15365 [bacterium]|nr:hypothetical protein [bacterium]